MFSTLKYSISITSLCIHLALFISISALPDFASYQYSLKPTLPYTLGVSNVSVVFSQVYPAVDYSRSVVLAGFKMQYQNIINFNLSIQTPTIDSGATIVVTVGNDTKFQAISVYVLLVGVNSDWVFIQEYQKVGLNSTSPPTGGLTDYLNKTVATCQWFLQEYHILKGFYVKSSAGQNISVNLSQNIFGPLLAPSMPIRIFNDSKYLGSVMYKIGYVTIYIDSNHTNFRHVGYFKTDIKINAKSGDFLTTTPNNFNILGSPAFSQGYNQKCVIGINSMIVASSSNSFVRSLWFNATTNPISDQANDVYQIGGVYENFMVNYTVICLISFACPFNTAVNLTTLTCRPCNIPNCVECATLSVCKTCMGSTAWDGVTCAASCLDANNNTCGVCNMSLYCQTCASDSLVKQIGPCGGTICISCAIFIPNCSRCLNKSYCLECVNSLYFLSINYDKCIPCIQLIPNCLTCYVNTTIAISYCTKCINSSYFINPNKFCSICSSRIPFCLTCNSIPQCTQCNVSYGLNKTDYTCFDCKLYSNLCTSCDSQRYTSCSQGFTTFAGGCECKIGKDVDNYCINITGCLGLNVMSGSILCKSCNTTQFQSVPVNNQCVCLVGVLVNGICNEMIGCLTPINSSGVIICKYCDIKKGFQSLPINGLCQCMNYLKLNSSKICQDICGDGIILTMERGRCDDGNTESGDGCSSDCKIEYGFFCVNTSILSGSICNYVGLLPAITLNQIKRVDGQNTGIFSFKITPAISIISKLDKTNEIKLDCPSGQYTTSSVTYSNGILSIATDYTKDMQGLSCSLQIYFNPALVKNNDTSIINFKAISKNMPLVVIRVKQFQNINLIVRILSCLALAIFILSLKHKMIGAQLMYCCQIVYISNCFDQTSSTSLSALKSLGWVTGGWSLFHKQSDRNLIDPFTDRVDLSKKFTESNLIVICLFVALGLVWIMFVAYRELTEKVNDIERLKKSINTTKLDIIIKVLYRFLVFPIAASFYLVLSISYYISSLRLENQSTQIVSDEINALILFVTFTLLAGILSFEFLFPFKIHFFKDVQIRGLDQNNDNKWYIALFILRGYISSLFIQIGISVGFRKILIFMACLQFIYILRIIFKRPYNAKISMFGVIICELTVFAAICLSVVKIFYVASQFVQLISVYYMIGLVVNCITLAAMRVYFQSKALISVICNSEKKSRENQQKQIKIKQGIQTSHVNKLKENVPQILNGLLNMHARARQGLIPTILSVNCYHHKKDMDKEYSAKEKEIKRLRKAFKKAKKAMNIP